MSDDSRNPIDLEDSAAQRCHRGCIPPKEGAIRTTVSTISSEVGAVRKMRDRVNGA